MVDTYSSKPEWLCSYDFAGDSFILRNDNKLGFQVKNVFVFFPVLFPDQNYSSYD